MGMFDTYGGTQLKAGECELIQYNLNDEVPIADGVYAGCDHFIVVKDGKFIAEVDSLYDNFGEDSITTDGYDLRLNKEVYK